MRGYTMVGLLAPVAACLIGAFFACAQLDLIQRQRDEIRALKAQAPPMSVIRADTAIAREYRFDNCMNITVQGVDGKDRIFINGKEQKPR